MTDNINELPHFKNLAELKAMIANILNKQENPSLSQITDLRNILDEFNTKLWDVLEYKNPTSVFFRLRGLLNHDIRKIIVEAIEVCDGLKFYIEEGIPTTDLFNKLRINLKFLIGFLNILLKCEKSSNKDTFVTSVELLETLPHEIDNGKYYLINDLNERVEIEILFEQFATFEEFISIRTLLINAMARHLKPRSTKIQVTKEFDSNFTIYRVYDNSTNGIWPEEEFISKIEAAYQKGLMNPYSSGDESERGAQIATFLAGQRESKLNTGRKMYSYDNARDITKLKSLSLVF